MVEAYRAIQGPGALDSLGAAFDDLADATGAPITARRPWLSAWARAYDQWDPWIHVIESDGVVLAAAPLARRHRGPLTDVVALGHGPSDEARLPARDAAAASALAGAVEAALSGLRRPWRLRLQQLGTDDPVAGGLAGSLPSTRLLDGEASPRVAITGRELRPYLSKNLWHAVKQAHNRLARDGLKAEVAYLTEPAAIEAALPEMSEVHRRRDRSLARYSHVDDAHQAPFWRAIAVDFAARGEVEVTTVRAGGRLMSYALALVDRGSYRIWTSHFDPEFAFYRPGWIADLAALERALARPEIDEYDFMRGEEPYKLKLATHVVPATHLWAWDGNATRSALELLPAAQMRFEALRERRPEVERAWRALKSRTFVRQRGSSSRE